MNMQLPVSPSIQSAMSFPTKMLLATILISSAMVGMVAYGFNIGYKMSANVSPLVHAAMEIKLEATAAHLWFEEMITGDQTTKIEEVLRHVDKAIWYANAMLKGGQSSRGNLVPLDDPVMRQEIQEVLTKIHTFRDITLKRYQASKTSGVGTPIEQKYDAIFLNFQEQADWVEVRLREAIASDLEKHRYLQLIVIFFLILLSIVHILIFYSHEKQRAKNLALIEETTAHVKNLQSLVPVCALCKQVRDDKSYWQQLEHYIAHYSEKDIGQTICTDCSSKFYPEFSTKYAVKELNAGG